VSSRTVAALLMLGTTHADGRVTVKRKQSESAEHDGQLALLGGHPAQKKPDPYGPCLDTVGVEMHGSDHKIVPADDTESDGWCDGEEDQGKDEHDDGGHYGESKDDCSGVGQEGDTRVDPVEDKKDKSKERSGGSDDEVAEDDKKGKACAGAGCGMLWDDRLRFAKIVERGNKKDVVFNEEIRQQAKHVGFGVLSDSRIELFVWLVYGLRPGRHTKVEVGKMERDRGFKQLRIVSAEKEGLADKICQGGSVAIPCAVSGGTGLFAKIAEPEKHSDGMTTKQREAAMKRVSKKWLAQLKAMLRTVTDAEMLDGNLFAFLKRIKIADASHQLSNDTVRHNFEDECKILFLRRRVQIRNAPSQACVARATTIGPKPLPEQEMPVAHHDASSSQAFVAKTGASGPEPVPEPKVCGALPVASPSQACVAKTGASGLQALSEQVVPGAPPSVSSSQAWVAKTATIGLEPLSEQDMPDALPATSSSEAWVGKTGANGLQPLSEQMVPGVPASVSSSQAWVAKTATIGLEPLSEQDMPDALPATSSSEAWVGKTGASGAEPLSEQKVPGVLPAASAASPSLGPLPEAEVSVALPVAAPSQAWVAKTGANGLQSLSEQVVPGAISAASPSLKPLPGPAASPSLGPLPEAEVSVAPEQMLPGAISAASPSLKPLPESAASPSLGPLPEAEVSVALPVASPSQAWDAKTDASGLQSLSEQMVPGAIPTASPSLKPLPDQEVCGALPFASITK